MKMSEELEDCLKATKCVCVQVDNHPLLSTIQTMNLLSLLILLFSDPAKLTSNPLFSLALPLQHFFLFLTFYLFIFPSSHSTIHNSYQSAQ